MEVTKVVVEAMVATKVVDTEGIKVAVDMATTKQAAVAAAKLRTMPAQVPRVQVVEPLLHLRGVEAQLAVAATTMPEPQITAAAVVVAAAVVTSTSVKITARITVAVQCEAV